MELNQNIAGQHELMSYDWFLFCSLSYIIQDLQATIRPTGQLSVGILLTAGGRKLCAEDIENMQTSLTTAQPHR